MCGFSKAWRFNKEGMKACNEGRFEEAEQMLLTGISMTGCKSKKVHRATMYNNLAVIYRLWNKEPRALLAYGKAIDNLNPENKGQACLIGRIMKNIESIEKEAA